jgi:hypothetical protein
MTATLPPRHKRDSRVEAAMPRMRALLAECPPEPTRGWQLRAACTGADPNEFIPADRPGKTPKAWDIEREVAANCRRARLDCLRCPVTKDCLAEGVRTESEGMWGGEYITAVDAKALKAVKEEGL